MSGAATALLTAAPGVEAPPAPAMAEASDIARQLANLSPKAQAAVKTTSGLAPEAGAERH
ncbi:MAG: hypothetical protein ACKVWR_01020 [Acidimicrobiales bacterium]